MKTNGPILSFSRRGFGRALAVAVLVLMPLTPSFAQDWKTERAQLVAAAQKEGTLVLFSQPNLSARTYLANEWAKAFPEIKLSITATSGAEINGRMRVERQTQKYLWDMVMTGANIGYEMAKDGFLDPVMPELRDPEVNKPEYWGGWDRVFVDFGKKYVFSPNVALKSPVYNALKLPREKVDKAGLQILFDPDLKGKIYWHDPGVPGPGAQFAFYLARRLGDDGLRKFITEQKPVFMAEQGQVIEALARGTAWLGLGPGNSHALMDPYVKAGVPVDVKKFGNSPDLNDVTLGGSTFFVVKDRPHPAATRLFINWLLSKDVQYGFAAATEQSSRRVDVASTADADSVPVPGARYVAPQEEEYDAALNKDVALVTEIRKSLH
jgi:iron(III) transport system substrate-binding protein